MIKPSQSEERSGVGCESAMVRAYFTRLLRGDLESERRHYSADMASWSIHKMPRNQGVVSWRADQILR
jgi:hypothetical protein